MEHQIFLSYSTKDAAFTEKLYIYLTGRGLACWMAPKSIAPGSEYGEAIIAGIEQAEVFVLVYSEHSNQSQHVLREVERCVNRNMPLIAYEIEQVQPTKSMEYFLMANQWMQAMDAPEKHMEELYDAIMALRKQQESKDKGKEAQTVGAAGGDETEHKIDKAARRGRTGSRRIAAACIFFAVVAAVIFFCVNNTQAGCGGDVPGERAENLLGRQENGTDSIATNGTNIAKNEENTNNTNAALSISPGEYLTFGRYYPQGQEDIEDADIHWIVLSVNAQEGTALLLTEKIIDMKPYDVAESGIYGYGADGRAYDRTKAEEYSDSMLSVFFGNSSWEYSNLRAWLNSSDGVVSYQGQEPVSKGTDDRVNGYQNQAGFLYDFTKNELERLVVTQIETPANSIESASVTEDRVFLLSVEEAEMYLDAQKISRYAAPTDAAIAASRGTIYPLYHSYSQETIPWYFRTPAADSAHEIMLCGSGFASESDVIKKFASSAGSGVRPAVVVRLRQGELTGDGTRINPYRITEE